MKFLPFLLSYFGKKAQRAKETRRISSIFGSDQKPAKTDGDGTARKRSKMIQALPKKTPLPSLKGIGMFMFALSVIFVPRMVMADVTINSPPDPTSLNFNEGSVPSPVQIIMATENDAELLGCGGLLGCNDVDYSISGVDAGDFTITEVDNSTANLSFSIISNAETPTDADGDNVYQVTVVADDTENGDNQDAVDLTITINDVNEFAPTITSTASPSVPENQTSAVDVNATTTDFSDGQSDLTYSITGGADQGFFAINPTSGVLSFGSPPDFENKLDAGGDGIYEVDVTVDDGRGMSTTQTISVTITDTNENPQITGTPLTTIAEDSAYSFTPVLTQEDPGDTISFSITNKPTWASFNTTTGALSGVPQNNDVGTTTNITITATDGGGLTDSIGPFTITVTNVNDAPQISGTPGDAVEDTPYTFTPSVFDVDNTLGEITFTETNLPSWLTLDTATGQISGTPQNADVGTDTGITITADDGTATDTLGPFDIAVSNTNDTPTATDDATTTPEDTTVIIPVLANDTDVDVGDTLSIQTGSVSTPANGSATTTAGGIAYDPDPNFNGSDSFGYTVEDTSGATDTATVNVTVGAVNDAPVITGTPPSSVVEGAPYTFTPNLTQVDPADTISFSIQNKPTWTTFNTTTGALSGTPDNADVGTDVNITITASDGNGGSDSIGPFSIIVSGVNDAPTISTIAPQTLFEDATSTVAFTLSDDSPTLTATATSSDQTLIKDGTLTITDLGGGNYTLALSPETDQNGTATITVTADDGTLTDTETFTVTITAVEDDPKVTNPNPPTTATEGVLYTYTPNVTIADAGDSVTFTATNIPSWASFSTTTGTISGTPGNGDDGVYPNITITVTDADGDATVIGAFSITVSSTNIPPTADFTFDDSGDPTVLFTASSTDADGTIASYLWDFGDSATSTQTNPSHTYTANNTFTVTLLVTDNDGATDSISKPVTISAVVGPDTTPPMVNTFTPADEATMVSTSTNLTLTFNESVVAFSGNITIKRTSDDGTVETIGATSSSVTGGGTNTITIDPSSDLSFSTGYYIQIDANTFADSAGNPYAGIMDKTTWNFTTVNASVIPPTADFTFDDSGDPTVLFTASSTDADGTIASYLWDFGDSATSTQTNPSHTYTANNTFTVTLLVTDNDGATDSISKPVTISAVVGPDTTPPSTPGMPSTNMSPTNDGTPTWAWTASTDSGSGLANPAYTVEWSQDPTFGSIAGSNTTNNTSFSALMVFSDGTWYFRVKASDQAGNDSAYSTAGSVVVDTTEPAVNTLTPADDATAISITTNLVISFSEVVSVDAGNITIKRTSDDGTVETIGATSSSVTGGGTNTITIDPSVILLTGTDYAIFIDSDTFMDAVGNDFDGISNENTWNFTTAGTPPPNDPPVIVGGASTATNAQENQTAVADIDATDPDPDPDNLTYLIAGGSDGAFFNIDSSTGILTFDTAPDFENPADTGGDGVYEVVVGVSDGVNTSTQNISVAVTDINENPVASDDGGSTLKNTAVLIDVLSNDTDQDGDTLTIISLTPPANGAVTTTTGGINYTPDAGFVGSDTFSYTVSDGSSTDTATVAVSVEKENTNGTGGALKPVEINENDDEESESSVESNENDNDNESENEEKIKGEDKYGVGGTNDDISKAIKEIKTKIANLKSQILALDEKQIKEEEETSPPKASCSFSNFPRGLASGDRGADVRKLQELLNCLGFTVAEEGPGSPGNETTYFGPLTRDAVIRYQEAYAREILIEPYGITEGTGNFFRYSQSMAQELSGEGF